MKMGFIAGQPGVQIIGFSEQHRLEQPHKDLETSPTTHRGLPRGSLCGRIPIQPKLYSICPHQPGCTHTPLQVWSAHHKHTINARRGVPGITSNTKCAWNHRLFSKYTCNYSRGAFFFKEIMFLQSSFQSFKNTTGLKSQENVFKCLKEQKSQNYKREMIHFFKMQV